MIPADNQRDLAEIDPVVRKSLNFITAQTVDVVLSAALNPKAELVPTLLSDIPGEVKQKNRKPGIRQ